MSLVQEPRPYVFQLVKKEFRRVNFGMLVQFARTYSPDRKVMIDHFTLSAPDSNIFEEAVQSKLDWAKYK